VRAIHTAQTLDQMNKDHAREPGLDFGPAAAGHEEGARYIASPSDLAVSRGPLGAANKTNSWISSTLLLLTRADIVWAPVLTFDKGAKSRRRRRSRRGQSQIQIQRVRQSPRAVNRSS
jgi:hypothetical protein